MSAQVPIVFLSSGEPAGIGPDICAMLAAEDLPIRLVTLADAAVLAKRIDDLDLEVVVHKVAGPDDVEPQTAGLMHVLDIPAPAAVRPGHPDPANSAYVLELLRQGVALCTAESHAALVTAPVNKSVINAAGIPFTGHTEFLAELTGIARPVMLLVAGDLRIALASTHMPLREVPDYLTSDTIREVLQVLHNDLKTRFRLDEPEIVVCGLNPHAGEGGHLGTEDKDIIAPVIHELANRGLKIRGPLPADTAFTPAAGPRDAILAMYHDQGLPVLKYAGFGHAVNVTLGLPIVRTSVDHGTALDIAGSGGADAGSVIAAIKLAAELAQT